MSDIKPTPRPWKTDGADLWHEGNSYDCATDPHIYTGIEIDKGLRESKVAHANLELCCDCVNTLADIPAPSHAKLAALLAACEKIEQGNYHEQPPALGDIEALVNAFYDFRAERSES